MLDGFFCWIGVSPLLFLSHFLLLSILYFKLEIIIQASLLDVLFLTVWSLVVLKTVFFVFYFYR